MVTPHPMVGYFIQRTAGDAALRATLAQLGADLAHRVGAHGMDRRRARWCAASSPARSTRSSADSLVLCTTNEPERTVADELAGRHGDVRVVGDAVAARLAVHAIHDGRVTGMAL